MVKEKKSFFEKIIKNSPAQEDSFKNEIGGDILKQEEPEKKNKFFPSAEEGQLSVDVYETDSAIVIVSIIGGVNEGDIDISIDNNILTISGAREKFSKEEKANYFVEECFWGAFSRSIILPVEVDVERVKAIMKNGVLKIELPKITSGKSKKIKIEKE